MWLRHWVRGSRPSPLFLSSVRDPFSWSVSNVVILFLEMELGVCLISKKKTTNMKLKPPAKKKERNLTTEDQLLWNPHPQKNKEPSSYLSIPNDRVGLQSWVP